MSKYVLNQTRDGANEARDAFRPGLKLFGFCCGHFGRDSYDVKTIVSVTDFNVTVIDSRGCVGISRDLKGDDWEKLLESSNRDLATGNYEGSKE